MLEGGTARAALQNLFVHRAPSRRSIVFCVAAQQRDRRMMRLSSLRAAGRRSRIFQQALRQIGFRAAALIFHEKCAPTFNEWWAARHSCFRISLVNANALATIASVVALVPTATFSQAKRKQTTNNGRQTRYWKTRRSALVTACGGTPGLAADSATSRS